MESLSLPLLIVAASFFLEVLTMTALAKCFGPYLRQHDGLVLRHHL
jgi:hypothetical protein